MKKNLIFEWHFNMRSLNKLFGKSRESKIVIPKSRLKPKPNYTIKVTLKLKTKINPDVVTITQLIHVGEFLDTPDLIIM